MSINALAPLMFPERRDAWNVDAGSREDAMTKPKNRPQRQSVEQEPAKDDEARLETFERATDRQNDDTLTRPDAPDSPVLDSGKDAIVND
jgi:hypothetical protein